MVSLLNSSKHLKNQHQSLTNFKKLEEEEIPPKSVYLASIILTPQPDKGITRKFESTLLINICAKILNKILQTKFSST
jgi:hypothetical protein